MPNIIRPYGDRRDDGLIQLAFTLPVPAGAKAKEAAAQFAKMMGFKTPLVASMQSAGENFSVFVVYGRGDFSLDFDKIEAPEVKHPKRGFDELNEHIAEKLQRKVVVVGACIGTDAHTTGIDAIFNMKGYSGDYGLERYPGFQAVNMGAQVEPAALVARAKELNADAILVSQIVTQRDIHKENARTLVELMKAEGLFGKMILVFGGPRVDHKGALDLGFDAGFGPGTKPSDVANYVYYRLCEKLGIPEE
jgi:beta-lysine 5,6-aminomutase beta subunit